MCYSRPALHIVIRKHSEADMEVKIVFAKSAHSSVRILGRSSEEYLAREFAAYDTQCAEAGETPVTDGETVFAVIPLDMPLVTAEDVERAAECMKKHKLSELVLGDGDTGAKLVRAEGGRTGYFLTSPHFVKVSDAKSFPLVYNELKQRVLRRLADAGVLIADFASTAVDDTAEVLPGAELMPFCRIEGATRVEEGARIEGSFLKDCRIERGARVVMSHLADTRVGARSEIGPFARLRGADVGEGCRVGDFVEIKNSRFGDGAKSAHLAYIGDAEVGERTNIGCGTVFCNYDGRLKHRTAVGKECFIGANVNLVAPVSVGDGAFVAAGTTVTEDVPEDAFVIGRSRKTAKPRKREKDNASQTER